MRAISLLIFLVCQAFILVAKLDTARAQGQCPKAFLANQFRTQPLPYITPTAWNGLRHGSAFNVDGTVIGETAGGAHTAVVLGSHSQARSSGIVGQISRVFYDLSNPNTPEVAYIAFSGETSLVHRDPRTKTFKEIPGWGAEQHNQGYSTPIGKVKYKGEFIDLADLGPSDLGAMGISQGKRVTLNYKSGIKVKGHLLKIETTPEGRILLLKFTNATVSLENGTVLFEPSWGEYDLLVGSTITASDIAPSLLNRFAASWD